MIRAICAAVSCFFQIDQNLDATADLALAANIPLVH
jgi:hypothetical protein